MSTWFRWSYRDRGWFDHLVVLATVRSRASHLTSAYLSSGPRASILTFDLPGTSCVTPVSLHFISKFPPVLQNRTPTVNYVTDFPGSRTQTCSESSRMLAILYP